MSIIYSFIILFLKFSNKLSPHLIHSSFLEVIILFWLKFPSSLKRPKIITLSVTTNKKLFSPSIWASEILKIALLYLLALKY